MFCILNTGILTLSFFAISDKTATYSPNRHELLSLNTVTFSKRIVVKDQAAIVSLMSYEVIMEVVRQLHVHSIVNEA